MFWRFITEMDSRAPALVGVVALAASIGLSFASSRSRGGESAQAAGLTPGSGRQVSKVASPSVRIAGSLGPFDSAFLRRRVAARAESKRKSVKAASKARAEAVTTRAVARKTPQRPETVLLYKGMMKLGGREPVALIEKVATGSTADYREGDIVARGYRIKAVSAHEVSIETKDGQGVVLKAGVKRSIKH